MTALILGPGAFGLGERRTIEELWYQCDRRPLVVELSN